MKRMLIALALASATLTAFAQTSTVTVNAKGDDVRSVITDMFKQSGKNFVINPGVRFVLYLSLDKIDFDQALTIVCKNASLKFDVQNGIYYISNNPPKTVEQKIDAPVIVTKTEAPKQVAPVKPKKILSPTLLNKRVITRYSKTDLREVMAALTKQTGVTIEIASDVPAYKLDAYLINTSLKYALDQITTAAKLEYRFTDNGTLLIARPAAAVATTSKKG